MVLVLLVVAVALCVGAARGGSFGMLAQLRLPGWSLVFLAVLAQLLSAVAAILGLPAPRAMFVLGTVVSAALAMTFVLRNVHVRGMPLVGTGLLLNVLVVLANGAMPVSLSAAQRAGVGTTSILAGDDPRHELAGDRTRLDWLADVVPVPLPGVSQVLSPGDVLIAAGIGVLVANGMIRPGSGRQARRVARSTTPSGPPEG